MQNPARLARPFGQALALRRPPLCSEIVLWLMAGDVDLEAGCRDLQRGGAPPYWAFCWGSGQALARWLLDHPEAAQGRRVVDLGCGSGVAGIAAALVGAREVVGVDVDVAARDATLANARENGIPPERLRVSAELPERWDVLLASDLLYEAPLRAALGALQRVAAERGGTILAGEPERPGNPGHGTAPLARYAARTFPDVDSPTVAACVYRLSG